MKQLFLIFAMALMSVFAVAQTTNGNQVVWSNGKVMYADPIPTVDSLIFTDNMVGQDTLHLLLSRTRVHVKHDTTVIVTQVVVRDTTYITECIERSDKFSVSADKQVRFAPGNLQYTRSTNTWSFAEHPYDVIGAANVREGALADKTDLFGWSSNKTTVPFGVSISTDDADYTGDFVDWGTNAIGTDTAGAWRTLSIGEWTYLFQHTRWTMAKVNGVLGFMLLPDAFTAPQGMNVRVLGNGAMSNSYLDFTESDYALNVYTAASFARLEAAGVVFLPCAGYRYGSVVFSESAIGYYWSSTSDNVGGASILEFKSTTANTYGGVMGVNGSSVRLVQDVK